MTERDVWFRFVKENGEPYKKSTIWEEGGTSALDEDTDTVGNRGNGKANALLVVVPTATDIESATESTRLINRNVSGE